MIRHPRHKKDPVALTGTLIQRSPHIPGARLCEFLFAWRVRGAKQAADLGNGTAYIGFRVQG